MVPSENGSTEALTGLPSSGSKSSLTGEGSGVHLTTTGSSSSLTTLGSNAAMSKSVRSGTGATRETAFSRRLKKATSIHMDNNMRTSLEAISDIYEDQGASGTERRNLRGALEKRTLTLHQTFSTEFSAVNDQFKRVSRDVELLCASVAKMQSALQQTKDESQVMVDQLAVLQTEYDEAAAKEDQVKSFLNRFHLTLEEKQILKGEVTAQFFTVLEKVKDIHNHCTDLLNAQHQQAGIEVMETTYLQQSQGYDKLNKWVHYQTNGIMSHEVPEVPTLFVRALHTLRDRGPLWCSCMKEIARTRRQALVNKFFSNLSANGHAHVNPNGSATETIEAQSDPLRYISDMLAWVHQSVAEENDLIDNFYAAPSPGQQIHSVSSAYQADATLEVSKADLLDITFEGLVKHFKSRVQSVLETSPSSSSANLAVFFRLESVLQFYCAIIPPLLGPNALLSTMLGEMKLQTLKKFFDMLKVLSDKLLASVPMQAPQDLSPPPIVLEALSKLTIMMDTLAGSLIPPEEREGEFTAVMSGIIDPLLTLLEKVEEIDPPSKIALSINCLQLMVSTLSEQPFTKSKAAKVSEKLDLEISKLVKLQSDALLRRCGLNDIQMKLSAPKPLSQHIPPEAMRDTIQGFYKYMYTLGSISLPHSDRIQAMRVKDAISTATTKNICDAYKLLYEAVLDPSNQYVDAQKMLQHTPENVSTLLDCN
eukprot:TRINITY_DN3702_c1_g1_i1.p1 TRINITY_DN3702_c1_g1~~TRINITY_DN3702_c1_g1_i1.p1  ORF type:complete len:706 (+),score=121.56 TRINITY_DN3702_c1_g1_i1:58-2175(+)